MLGAFRLNTLSAAVNITATGGTINLAYSNGTTYKVHSFTTAGSASFVVSSTVGKPIVDALIVGAGGGSGGSAAANGAVSGGGGGGRVQLIYDIPISPQTYSLTVGTGGTAGTSSGTAGGTGGSTIALGYTSIGGGGSAGTAGAAPAAGAAGGGGGSAVINGGGTSYTAGTGTFGGGNYSVVTSPNHYGGGGGGSNLSVGGNANSSASGSGANGPSYSITGTSIVYGSGGVGGQILSSTGTDGSGTIGKGALGKGNASTGSGNAGNAGGIIIRYPTTSFNLQYITNATSTSSTITIPSSAQAGDIAILIDVGYANVSITSVTPTGFTNFNSNSSQTGTNPQTRGITSYKVLVGGDPGSTITGISTTTMQKLLVIYRPSYSANTISLFSGSTGLATASAPSNQTLTLSQQISQWFIGFAVYSSSGSVTARGSTTTATRELNVGTGLYVKFFEGVDGATTFSDSTISMADYGSNYMATDGLVFS